MKLNDDTFMLYAAKYYNNLSCYGMDEFYGDIKHIKYVKRLFNKYEKTGELKERLILNHLVVLYNVFDVRACTEMLRFRMPEYIKYLKPFLAYLNYWGNLNDGIIMDQRILERLREL